MTTRDPRNSLANGSRWVVTTGLAVLLGLAVVGCGGNDYAEHAEQAEHAVHSEHANYGDQTEHTDHTDHTDHADHADHPTALPAIASGLLPGTSIYHLASAWTDHHGEAFTLPALRGSPAVFVMFYGDCTTACPLLVKSAEDISETLSPEQRDATSFVMVTFDTDSDTPEKLAAYAADKGLTADNWHWLVGSPLQTRQLATLLGVQYRDAGNGVFAHSNVVTVVDRNGVPSARLEGLGIDLDPAVAAIAKAAAN